MPPPGAQGLGNGWVFSALLEVVAVVVLVAEVEVAEDVDDRLPKGLAAPKPS